MTTGCLAGRFNPGEGGGSFQTKFFLYIILERKEITVLCIIHGNWCHPYKHVHKYVSKKIMMLGNLSISCWVFVQVIKRLHKE